MTDRKYRPLALFVLDGWGLSAETEGNAVKAARTPYLDKLFAEWKSSKIYTSGLDVGLPEGQMGNSEVGHTNIGAGRVVYQDLMRINLAIEDKSFYENEALRSAMISARDKGKALHLAGLLSDGGVHSHINHLYALLEMAKSLGLEKVYIHAFYDGRDTPPESGLGYTEKLESFIQKNGIGKIASVSGRYYAMDRDKRWDRVAIAYRALTDIDYQGTQSQSASDYIRKSYADAVTDEFLIPAQLVDAGGRPIALLEPGDSFIFFNFRPDRARELTRALMDVNFADFETLLEPGQLDFVSMTEYDSEFNSFKNLRVAFETEDVTESLGEIFSRAGLTQLRAAETEKYAHVTFFFNGGREESFPGEDRLLIASPKVATYDLQPEMSAPELTATLAGIIAEDKYDLYVVNYANCDMVGHTGIFSAAVAAVETVDKAMAELVPLILARGGAALITADHGNAESMFDHDNGGPLTAHSSNPVPLILAGVRAVELEDGRLADLAPTILELADLKQPEAMTGKSLIRKSAGK
ncbi:MAG: 2,3-bisphosphoglycerate-independent phosphoglycerate mutase [Clostridiaceae bacterium]|nr:2,3-bisphosphoglycerate-independent phosphoglycerate mutase [Clostridiaceae bacterium]